MPCQQCRGCAVPVSCPCRARSAGAVPCPCRACSAGSGAGRWHRSPAVERAVCRVPIPRALAAGPAPLTLPPRRCGCRPPAELPGSRKVQIISSGLFALSLQLPAGELWIRLSPFLSEQVNGLWGSEVRKISAESMLTFCAGVL